MKGKTVYGHYYNKYETNNPIHKLLVKNYLKSFKETLSLIDFKNILEVGCGEGYIIKEIHKNFNPKKIVGIDISEDIITNNKEKFSKNQFKNIKFQTGNAESLSFKDNSFDLVTACQMLEHVDNYQKVTNEVHRITNKYVVISVPREPLWRFLNFIRGSYIISLGNTPGHINHWSKHGICKLLEKKFKILTIKTPPPWTMILLEKK